jgi:lysyl-tRNA synthetase class 2
MDETHRLIQERLGKLRALEAQGAAVFPYRYERTHRLAEAVAEAARLLETATTLRVAGRVMALRRHGRAAFAHLEDQDGRLQVYVRQDQVGEQGYDRFGLLEVGDLLGCEGKLMVTRSGELTLDVTAFTALAKCLRPLPEKWHGLQDVEVRYRQRYLDLIMNRPVRDLFVARTRVVQEMRAQLIDEGFLEVETPILQPLYGGAAARPFTTTHNALGGATLYLRIADELYLKRLIVGGFDRVFEFGKDFRNEGIDRTHNPEFTMLECYAAYWDYEDVMGLVARMFARLAACFAPAGRLSYGGHTIELGGGFRRAGFFDLIGERTGVDFRTLDRDAAAAAAGRLDVHVDKSMGRGKILDEVFGTTVQPALIQPTFVCDYPVELSPLARRHRHDPALVERFEAFVAATEVANAFSELNDARDQRARFEEQQRLRAAGDEEAQQLDEDYLRALEYGMPPTGGLGMGVDRIAMLFTGAPSIRDVLLFPQLRPEGDGPRGA